MSSSIHLPNAVDPVTTDDVKIQVPPTLESLEIKRNTRRQLTSFQDTSQVRAQLERIATLLDEGFKKSEQRKKAEEMGLAAPLSSRRKSGASNRALSMSGDRDNIDREYTLLQPNTNVPRPVIGGTPISASLAISLRRVVYGSTVHGFSKEWKRSGFLFKSKDTPFQYGLITDKTGSRGLILCVQAYIIRHLVFKYKTKDEIFSRDVLHPSNYERQRALIQALSGILWRAGNRQRCCVCLPQSTHCFNSPENYRPDNITEKLHLFEFYSYEETEKFIKRYITYFEYGSGPGCVLFLYSLVLSRTIPNVLHDYGVDYDTEVQLLTDYEECTQPLINLLLAGRATTLLENGNQAYDERGQVRDRVLVGIPERCEVGMLIWDKEEDPDERTKVGSMLRTPKFPIWLTLVNGTFGLLFALNPDLMGDWRVEHKFQLRYYTGLMTQAEDTRLNIDTRFGRKMRAKTARSKKREQLRVPAIEQAIMTKWFGAEVDWNGTLPFV